MTADIEWVAGDTLIIEVPVVDANGLPKDLSGVQDITYTMAKDTCYNEVVVAHQLGDGSITVLPVDPQTNPDNNKYQVRIEAIETVDFCGVYSHKSRIVDAVGNAATVFRSDNVIFS